jgi:hypothetical protein
MAVSLSEQCVVSAAKDQLSCDLGGEAAVLNVKTGVYYGLDPVGARIWNLIQQPRPIHEIRDVLLEEFDVEAGKCSSDLFALLERLQAEGLIEVLG